jgi:hypothetical protein
MMLWVQSKHRRDRATVYLQATELLENLEREHSFFGLAVAVAPGTISTPLFVHLGGVHVHNKGWLNYICTPDIPVDPPFLLTDRHQCRCIFHEDVDFVWNDDCELHHLKCGSVTYPVAKDHWHGALTVRIGGWFRKRRRWKLWAFSEEQAPVTSGDVVESGESKILLGRLQILDEEIDRPRNIGITRNRSDNA